MARKLFERQYDMITECTRLEDLMPSYANLMHKIGSIIRNKVWKIADEKKLAYILFCCNNTFYMFINLIGEYVEFADFYVKLLIKYWRLYSYKEYADEFAEVYQMVHSIIADEITKDQWDRINTYYEADYSDDDIYGKRFTEILEDFIGNVDSVAAEEFFIKEEKLDRLVRARRGIHSLGEEIVPPSIETAKKYNIINRWNPSDRRYTYLAVETDDVSPDEVCLEEIRSKPGEEITLVDFKVRKNAQKKRLLNLAYEGVDDSIIESEVSVLLNNMVQEDIGQIKQSLLNGESSVSEAINKAVDRNSDKAKILANLYIGRKLLSTICRVVFIPLDEDEDNDPCLKNKCYKSFHVLAQFLESNNLDGVIYPSTRMMLKEKKGVNVVLFEPDDVEPIQETIRHVIR